MSRSAAWSLSLVLLAPSAQDPGQQAAVLQRAAELARPVAQHALLARLVGNWQVEVVTRDRDGRERTERGTIEGTAQLGGRYVELHHRWSTAGGPLEGLQVLGYHTLHQLYTSSWRDDRSTWAVDCSGVPDAAAPDRLVLNGALVDARDPAGRAFRFELELDGDTRVTARVFDTEAGALVLRQTQRWTRP
ncbi:MAG: DUF1579 family protein [Planctomycetes bacterium]|nr:DUF1579 family protein [Planctomycetota bacterium]